MKKVISFSTILMAIIVNTACSGAKKQTLFIYNWTYYTPNSVIKKIDAEAFAKAFAAGEIWVAQGYAENIFAELPEKEWSKVVFFIPNSRDQHISTAW